MLKDEASFVSIGFEFLELEDKNLKHNFLWDPMLKVRKFQNSVKEASGRKEMYIRRILFKNAKR